MRPIPAFARSLASVAFAAATLFAQSPDAATLASLKWRSIGPVNMAGRMTDLAIDPRSSKTFYVSGAGGGIWKTVNGGTSGARGRGGRGGGGGGGGGFGRGNNPTAETGDYRVVLDVAGQKQTSVLRVVRVQPGDTMVMAPKGR